MEIILEEGRNCLKCLEGKKDELVERGIAVENSNPEGCLLFVGMNPSYKKGEPVADILGYNLDDKNIHQYFKKARDIADNMNLPFGHHDLFPVRETSQKVIEGMFDVKKDGQIVPKGDYKDFINKSLLWSEQSIISCEPRAIVVINAFASRILFDCRVNGKSLLGFVPNKKWCEELGVDFVPINDKMVPVLFSGMLSGQRALDNYSERRLHWHIRHIFRHQELWPKF